MNKVYSGIPMYLLVAIFLIGIVSADSFGISGDFGTFAKDSCVNLRQTCADCSFVNITSLLLPNSTNFLGQVAMTKDGTEYNYSFCNTTVSGKYLVSGKGDPSSNLSIWNYAFFVNPSGIPSSDSRTSAITRTIYFIFLISVLLFVGGFLTKNLTYRISLFLLSSLLVLVGINFIGISLQDEVVNPLVENFFMKFTAFSFYIYFALFFILAVLWIFAFINTWIQKETEKKLRRIEW